MDWLTSLFSPEEWSVLGAVAGLLGTLIVVLGIVLTALGKLGAAIGWIRRGGKPAPDPPPQPGRIVEQETPKRTYPPIRPPGERTVIGREADRERLRSILATGRGAQITSAGAVLQGEGGRGKTTLARYYAETSRDLYDGGRWVLASEASPIMESLAAFGAAAFDMPVPQAITPAHAEAVLQAISTCEARLLFVYDNVDDFQAIKHLLPKGDKVDLILTTRISDSFPGYGQIPLDVLAHDSPDSPAVELLLQEAGQWNADAATRAAAQRLAADLGGLPLALVVAGALARQGTAFDTLCDRIGELVVTRPSLGNDYPDSVAAAVRLSLDSLDADARRLVELCAWLDPDRIAEEVFTSAPAGDNWAAVTEDIPEEVQTLLTDAARVRTALRALQQRSLLQPGETGLAVHRLTAEVLRRDAPDPQIPARAAAAILAADYPGGEKPADPANWAACRRLTPHVAALWEVAAPLWRAEWGQPGWPAMEFALSQCGVFLNTQTDFRGAQMLLRAALELMERRVDAADRALPLALGNLSTTLAKLGEFEEAADKIDRAIALDEIHRPGSAELAARYMQKVNLYIRRAEAGDRSGLDAAEPWIDKARAIRERLAAGQPRPDVANCWNNLGYLRRLQGRQSESSEAAQTALDMLRQVPGVNRAGLATYAMNVGGTWLEAGAPDKAAPLLREAHGIHTEIFDDPQNTELQKSASWLVSCLLTLARAGHDPERNRAEAEALCRTHGLDWDVEQRDACRYPTRPDESGAG